MTRRIKHTRVDISREILCRYVYNTILYKDSCARMQIALAILCKILFLYDAREQ